MENVLSAIYLGEARPVLIADVRGVPLDQLAADADAVRMVAGIMRRQENPSGVDVAMFNSAI